jgi:hypothetical protein
VARGNVPKKTKSFSLRASGTQKCAYGIVEPMLGPAIPLGDASDNNGQPIRPRATNLGNVDILCREAEVACEHECRAAEYGDVEPRMRRNRSRANLVEGRKQLIAIESGHASRPLVST